MAGVRFGGIAISLVAMAAWGQVDPQQQADSRTVLGAGNEYLSAGADAIRAGLYDDGIRLTKIGLERAAKNGERAAALSNLCAAHAAKGDTDLAIKACGESLAINDQNWRAYSNRAYAYYLKGMYAQASADLEAAAQYSPNARQVQQIRGMINERQLRPSVIVEEHQ
ncbi:MAG TPA: tetratricopeptide repeat protein [Gammaproteobacteria bacterium]|jgi:tetratricopeptide (TPR) repeat protein|nr:tetratricopeptide repeat protein [Gammaproteobacteria bacterium]